MSTRKSFLFASIRYGGVLMRLARFTARFACLTVLASAVVLAQPLATIADDGERISYKLLATSKTSTMQKELRQTGAEGFHYCGQSVAETAFGGQEVIVILQREIGGPHKTYLYKLLATTRTNTMQKELNQAGEEGFELMGLTVSKTAFGGQELVSILMRASD